MNYEAGDKEYDFYEEKLGNMIVVFAHGKVMIGELISHHEDHFFITGKVGEEMICYKHGVCIDDYDHQKIYNR